MNESVLVSDTLLCLFQSFFPILTSFDFTLSSLHSTSRHSEEMLRFPDLMIRIVLKNNDTISLRTMPFTQEPPKAESETIFFSLEEGPSIPN